MQRQGITPQHFDCPSCHAEAGEPCKLANFGPEFSHVSRCFLADAAEWEQLSRELTISTGWTVGS